MRSSPQSYSKMDYVIEVFLILAIARVCLGDECSETLNTVKNVTTCPRNKQEWEAGSRRLDCNVKVNMTPNCENARYHCLVDASRKTLVEVCTVPRNLNGYCPLFYEKYPFVRNDYNRDCTKDKPINCSSFYSSADAYKYQGCYNISQWSTTTKSASTPMSPSVTTHKSTIITVQPLTIPQDKTANQNEEEDKNNNPWWVIFPILALIYLIVVCYLRIRKDFTWCKAWCFPKYAIEYLFKNNTQATAPADERDVHQNPEETVPIMLESEDHEHRAEDNELPMGEQSRGTESIAHTCSENSTSYTYPGVLTKVPLPVSSTIQEDRQDGGAHSNLEDGELQVDSEEIQFTGPEEFSPMCVNDPCNNLNNYTVERRATEQDQRQDTLNPKMVERNMDVLEKGLEKADKRIFQLLKEQYKLEGRVKYLEIKLNCIKPLIEKLEKDLCRRQTDSSHEAGNGESLEERIEFLESAYICILKTIEKIEPNFNINLLPASSPDTNPEASTSGVETTDAGASGCNYLKKVEKLESSLLQIEQRLNRLYDERFGKQGQLKSFFAKLQGLECAVERLEREYGSQVGNLEIHDERTLVDKAQERLDKLFERLENLDLHILK
ncbi:uncharacterized protein LOC134231227 [Saccostrea cucullata]|uniref:uncharacterized protein LOC134231227 n=1 Tax=Saccostrea cuccullata TaxID=36930 RepID=UPI002ED41F65